MNVPIITDVNKVPQPASGYVYPFVIYVNNLPILKAKTNSNQIITFDNTQWYTVPQDTITIQGLPARVTTLQNLDIDNRLTALQQGGSIPENLQQRLLAIQRRLGSESSGTSSTIEQRLKLLEDTAQVLYQI